MWNIPRFLLYEFTAFADRQIINENPPTLQFGVSIQRALVMPYWRNEVCAVGINGINRGMGTGITAAVSGITSREFKITSEGK